MPKLQVSIYAIVVAILVKRSTTYLQVRDLLTMGVAALWIIVPTDHETVYDIMNLFPNTKPRPRKRWYCIISILTTWDLRIVTSFV